MNSTATRHARIGAALLVVLFAACAREPQVPTVAAETLLDGPPPGAVILDVRTRQEFADGHVPGAINVPHREIGEHLGELAAYRDAPVIVYCESGGRAARAEADLLAAGFADVRHLEGDMRGWRSAARPIAR